MLKDIERLSVSLVFVSSFSENVLPDEEKLILIKLYHFHRNTHLELRNKEGYINRQKYVYEVLREFQTHLIDGISNEKAYEILVT